MRWLFACTAAMALLGATGSLADQMMPANASTQVKIENYSFKPATVTVFAGTAVTWKNLDDDPHTVTANDGSFDSHGLAQGDTWSHQFSKPGTYTYHCSVHPMMQAVVIVRSKADGSD